MGTFIFSLLYLAFGWALGVTARFNFFWRFIECALFRSQAVLVLLRSLSQPALCCVHIRQPVVPLVPALDGPIPPSLGPACFLDLGMAKEEEGQVLMNRRAPVAL